MTEAAEGSLSIRACRLEDRESVLELWRQADAIPGVTDTADDLRRVIAESPELAAPPDQLEITLEPNSGSQTPTGTVILTWPAP